MDWYKYFDLANHLSASMLDELGDANEACFRSSISRAYYCAFLLMRDKKGLQDFTSGEYELPSGKIIKVGAHQKVVLEYKNSTDKTEQSMGRSLGELKVKRIQADYIGNVQIRKDHVERVIIQTNELLANL